MDFNTIALPVGDRKLRFGFGQHSGLWYARLDLWWYGFRISEKV